MIAVVQRVVSASVVIEEKMHAQINSGLLVLVGIENADGMEDIDWLCSKIAQLRIFNDAEGVMNVGLRDIGGEALVVSQFTLHANVRKGNRPSYIKAARPEKAIPLYEKFVQALSMELGRDVKTGVFGADMKVHLVNDGPVTILIDSKGKS